MAAAGPVHEGEAVASAQYLLSTRFVLRKDEFDDYGKLGSATVQVIRTFQQEQGLTVDGIVGSETWQALIVTTKQGDRGFAPQAVQSQLFWRGASTNELDGGGNGPPVGGSFGPQTDAVVRLYQQSQRLTIDGVVGPETWQALLSGA